MKKSLFISLALISSTVPFIASAQSKITELGNSIKAINSSIVVAAATLFMALATAAFFFGMAKFIYASREGDQKEITNGKQFMLWSVIALFVMFSIYGIIDFGQGIFDIKGKTDIVLPSFKIGGSTVGGGGAGGGSAASGLGGGSAGGGSVGGGSAGASGNCLGGTVCYTCTGSNYCICQNAQCIPDPAYASGQTKSPVQVCIDNGGDAATCECEAQGGIMNLNSRTCEYPSGAIGGTTIGGGSAGGGSAAQTPLQQCLANGNDQATCDCEAKGGVMGTDGTCSMSSSSNTTKSGATRNDCESDPSVCNSNETCGVEPGAKTFVAYCYTNPA